MDPISPLSPLSPSPPPRDEWEDIFPRPVLERFNDEAWRGLAVEFEKILKYDKQNAAARLGLGLCNAAWEDFPKAATFLGGLSGLSLGKAVRRFLPGRYELWLHLAEELFNKGEARSAAELCECIFETSQTSKIKDDILNRCRSLGRKIHSSRKVLGASPLETWCNMCNIKVCGFLRKRAVRAATVTLLLGFAGLMVGKVLIARVYLHHAEDNLYRGLLCMVHIKRSHPESAQRGGNVFWEGTRTSGDKNLPVRYLESALSQLRVVLWMDEGNLHARFLGMKCYEMLRMFPMEKSRARQVSLQAAQMAGQIKAIDPMGQSLRQEEKQFEEHRRALLSGARSKL